MSDDTEVLPSHIAESVQSLLELHREQHSRKTTLQNLIARMTAAVGRPRSVGVLTGIVLFWIMANLILMQWGHKPVDAPPFYWLQGSVSLFALYTTILILTTQRQDDELAVRREQLTLELAVLSEQKIAKVIRLLEEIRRDSPHLRDRVDGEADDMAQPSDPKSVLNAITTGTEL